MMLCSVFLWLVWFSSKRLWLLAIRIRACFSLCCGIKDSSISKNTVTSCRGYMVYLLVDYKDPFFFFPFFFSAFGIEWRRGLAERYKAKAASGNCSNFLFGCWKENKGSWRWRRRRRRRSVVCEVSDGGWWKRRL